MNQLPNRINEALLRAGAALGKACAAAADFVVAMSQFAAEVLPYLSESMERQAALGEAPPRVRHLAKHGKKLRTRKKNSHRALREYQRRRKQ